MNTCLIFLLFATNPILAFIPGTSHGNSNIKYEGSNTHGATLITNPIDISDSVISTGIRRDEFPILRVNAYEGKKLIYLDSAASSQKPEAVIRTMNHYYENTNANVHRGAHSLGNQATELYEEARNKVASFVNANRREEIVFTRGATEAINLVAQSWTQRLKPGDEIIVSVMEHHSNLVPWQMAALRTGAKLKFVRLTPDQSFDLDHFKSLLTSNTKLVAVSHASNVLGSVNPVEEIIKLTHAVGGLVLLDACQSVPHMPVDVQALNVDFLVASGHKMCGPTGIGFLYGCYNHLLSMPPINGGGEMIDEVKLEYSTYALPPSRFEAGTPAIAEVIGLGAACDYLKSVGMDVIHNHEIKLGAYLYQKLNDVQGTTLYGPLLSTGRRTGVVAFNMKTIHASDLAFFLDQEGVAIRTGHHCAQPLHGLLGVKGSARASLYFYNNKEDVDLFIEKMVGVINMFETMNNVL